MPCIRKGEEHSGGGGRGAWSEGEGHGRPAWIHIFDTCPPHSSPPALPLPRSQALHYKELEFQTSPLTAVEALIHINNQLRQPEAAVRGGWGGRGDGTEWAGGGRWGEGFLTLIPHPRFALIGSLKRYSSPTLQNPHLLTSHTSVLPNLGRHPDVRPEEPQHGAEGGVVREAVPMGRCTGGIHTQV